MYKLFLGCLSVVVLCSSCAFNPSSGNNEPNYTAPTVSTQKKFSLIDYDYHAVELLLQRIAVPIDKSKSVLVASLANIDSLEESSTFGRTVSDHYTSYLVNQGYTISEVKLRNDLLVKQKQGEFMLSRSARKILRTHNVQLVVVGTYSIGAENVFINARLVNPVNNVIMAAVDYKVKIDGDVRAMLKLK